MQPEFAILALRHFPDRAMWLVRASLRSSVPICVQEMVAILAAIGRDGGRPCSMKASMIA
jgi:hypothetical protein